jgi:hypothetical protein
MTQRRRCVRPLFPEGLLGFQIFFPVFEGGFEDKNLPDLSEPRYSVEASVSAKIAFAFRCSVIRNFLWKNVVVIQSWSQHLHELGFDFFRDDEESFKLQNAANKESEWKIDFRIDQIRLEDSVLSDQRLGFQIASRFWSSNHPL